jgi:hypothetical protein
MDQVNGGLIETSNGYNMRYAPLYNDPSLQQNDELWVLYGSHFSMFLTGKDTIWMPQRSIQINFNLGQSNGWPRSKRNVEWGGKRSFDLSDRIRWCMRSAKVGESRKKRGHENAGRRPPRNSQLRRTKCIYNGQSRWPPSA